MTQNNADALLQTGPDIPGTRVTVYHLLPYLLDASATEDQIAKMHGLTARQVATARAYVLNHPETVLSEHLRIEERIAAGNAPEVTERASQTRAKFLQFKEWLEKQQAEGKASTSQGEKNSVAIPTFREWQTEQESQHG